MRLSGVRTFLGLLVIVALGAGWSAPVPLATRTAPASHHGHRSPHGDHCKVPADGQCIGHQCCFSAGTPTGAFADATHSLQETRTTLAPTAPMPLRSAAKHLLPFAQAPPFPIVLQS